MKALPRGFWWFALAFVLVTSLPYVVGYMNAPEDGAFTGNAFEQTRVDFNSHLAKIELGREGAWTQHILFTPEEHPGLFINPFYLALGHVARLLGWSNIAVYHLARLVLCVVLLVVIALFAARFLDSDRKRWYALLLATVVGGAGWVLYLVAPAQTADLAPIEFWLQDAYTFWAALTFPHFMAAICFLLGYFLALDRWLHRPDWRGIGWLAGLSLALGWVQPFDLLLTGLATAILYGWAFLQRRLGWRHGFALAVVAAAHAIPVGYHLWALNSDTVWKAFTEQNVTASPPVIYYLLGYAWLLVPAGTGLVALWRARDDRLLTPVVWIGLVAILVYVPLVNQRRYLMGVQVPLAVLGAVGLEAARRWWLARGWRLGRWRLLLTTGLLFSALTHVLLVVSAISTLNPATRPELFLTRDQLTALDWVRAQPQDTVFFSTFPTGGMLAAQTGRRVYIGHWIETMHFEAREALVAAFFDESMTDDERFDLLDTAHVDYVWIDDSARALGDWPAQAAPFMAPVFAEDTITIYEVAR
jgi:uncharacterized membrane protein YhaH (DUF805 family)